MLLQPTHHNPTDTTATKMAAPNSPQSNLSSARLLETGEISDLTIICQERPFLVHKAILCPQSQTITDMCNSTMKEGTTGVITHEEFDADTLWCMLQFAYKKAYEVTTRPQGFEMERQSSEEAAQDDNTVRDEEGTSTETGSLLIAGSQEADGVALSGNDIATNDTTTDENEDPTELSHIDKWVTHARVYALADYYSMFELRAYALSRFRAVADQMPTWDDLPGFIAVIKEVGELTKQEVDDTEDTLRSELLKLISHNATLFAADKWFINALRAPELHDIMADMFRALGHRIAKDEETAAKEAKTLKDAIEGLEKSLEDVQAACATEVSNADQRTQSWEEKHDRLEAVMDNLVQSLGDLPEDCRNSTCSNTFGPLSLERRNLAGPNGIGQGEWQIRCGASNGNGRRRRSCMCRLN